MKKAIGKQPKLYMCIIDVIQDDIEQVSSILNLLNNNLDAIGWREYFKKDISQEEVIKVLEYLIIEKLVDVWDFNEKETELIPVYNPSTNSDSILKYWYLPSKKGQKLWESWEF